MTEPPVGMAVMRHSSVTVPSRVTTDRDRWTMALPVESLGRCLGHFEIEFAPSRAPFHLSVDTGPTPSRWPTSSGRR